MSRIAFAYPKGWLSQLRGVRTDLPRRERIVWRPFLGNLWIVVCQRIKDSMAHRAAPPLIFIAFSGSGLELMSADRVTPPDHATGLGRDVRKAQIAILGGVPLAADLWCQPTRGGIGCRSIRICFPGLNCLASRTAPKQIAERLTRVSVTSRTPESITRTPVVLVDSNTLRREVVVPSGQQLGYISNSLTCKRSSFLFPGDPPNLLTLRTGEIVIRDI